MNMTKEEALTLLEASGVFFPDDDEAGEHAINLNDAFWWAVADGEKVEDEELIEVGSLFFHYGWCGILYWVSKKRNLGKVEFFDINRFIDFVKHEEELVEQEPDTNKRAYMNIKYELGE
jgi:hypothetical protein